jgi:hypothetical protein
VLDWRSILLLRDRGIGFATITLAAGISSTGDADEKAGARRAEEQLPGRAGNLAKEWHSRIEGSLVKERTACDW